MGEFNFDDIDVHVVCPHHIHCPYCREIADTHVQIGGPKDNVKGLATGDFIICAHCITMSRIDEVPVLGFKYARELDREETLLMAEEYQRLISTILMGGVPT